MVSEAYGFPLKPFLLSFVTYGRHLMVPELGAERQLVGAAQKSKVRKFLHFRSSVFGKWSPRGRILRTAGRRGGSRGAGGGAAARFRDQEFQKRYFRNFKGGTPQVWLRVRA